MNKNNYRRLGTDIVRIAQNTNQPLYGEAKISPANWDKLTSRVLEDIDAREFAVADAVLEAALASKKELGLLRKDYIAGVKRLLDYVKEDI